VLRGEMVEITDDDEHCGRSCSVLVKPAGTPHANRFLGRTPVRTVSLQFSRSSPFTSQLGPLRWLESVTATQAAVTFIRGDIGEEARAHDFAQTILSIEAAPAAPPAWFTELRAILDRRFAEPLRFDELARRFGLHPVYVSRAFQRYAGTSMRDYVRGLRLRAAGHLLVTTRRSAAAIALDAGFADASHLTRTFGSTLGLTPRTFRRLYSGVAQV
jgi:AraC family transcriptional regulator